MTSRADASKLTERPMEYDAIFFRLDGVRVRDLWREKVVAEDLEKYKTKAREVLVSGVIALKACASPNGVRILDEIGQEVFRCQQA